MSDSWSLHNPSSSFNPDSGDWSQVGDPSQGVADVSWGDPDSDLKLNDAETKRFALIYLIDFTVAMQQNSMLRRVKKEENSVKTEDSCLNQSIDALISSLKNKIIASPDDLVGVALMGTSKKSNNPLNTPSIHQLVPLQSPSAALIKEIASLKQAYKQDEIGIGSESSIDLSESLRVAYTMFSSNAINQSSEVKPEPDADDDDHDVSNSLRNRSNQSKASMNQISKKILIFTCQDCPVTLVGNPDAKNRTVQRAKDLRESDIALDLLPFNTNGHTFDWSKFYELIISIPDDETYESNSELTFDDMLNDLLRKSSKKRTLGTMVFMLGNGVQLSTKLYCLYHEAKKESPKFLDAASSVALTSETKLVDSSTGAFVEKDEIVKYYPFGTSRAYLTDAELKEIKTFGPPGIQLMGFKPIERLKDYHNTRSPYFLQPDETKIRGSSRAFYALLLEMNDMKQMAVVRLIYRQGTPPRLAVLLPQLEERTKQGGQIQGPGFHCVFLPYADDIRQIKAEDTAVAPDEITKLAAAVIEKLTAFSFDPAAINNPTLQRHFAMVEARALDEAPREVEDSLLPDEGAFEACRYEQDQFNTAAFQVKPEKPVSKSRAKPAASKKRVKSEMGDSENDEDDDYALYDWEALKETTAEKGNKAGLGKLTLPQLKVYLLKHGLEKGGKKDDVVTRIANHKL